MKRWLGSLAVLSMAVGVIVDNTSHGQFPAGKSAPLGPGEKGATLRIPGLDTPSAPVLPSYVPRASAAPGGLLSNPFQTRPERIALPPSNSNTNKDLQITPDVGPWAIYVISYSGPEAPTMARRMVEQLWKSYKLRAHVFNYGAKEKEAEYKRVQELRKKQTEELAEAGFKGSFVPIPVRAVRIKEQTGVLLGGYRSYDEGAAALKKMRAIKIDRSNFDVKLLDIIRVDHEAPNEKTKKLEKVKQMGVAYNNPFLSAFLTRNPSLPPDHVGSTHDDDMKYLRKVNDGEKYSLLQCKAKLTLVVKQFSTPHKTVGQDVDSRSIWKTLLRPTGREWQDHAAHNAHNLAEGLRKAGLPESYVLHCRYCSFVTVGGYRGIDDPQLTAMQNFLASHFRREEFRKLDMYPRPIPMAVPH
ncbi:MAG: hypothetical protein HYX68_05515 [Planctomycetes bacterium]|nr:hypothetical protein [Planctomycetota bacterium]